MSDFTDPVRAPVSPEKRKGFFESVVAESTEVTSPASKIYVYEGGLRFWHWVNALCIVVLCATGYLIAFPPPSVPGEASENFLFGYIRLVHFAAGQILVVMFLFRVLWAFIGNHHARQLFLPPVWSAKWWREVVFEIRWYAFLTQRPKKYVGHNPLAQLAMLLMFVLPLINQILTGLALYAEGQGIESWWHHAFGWVFAVYGDSFTVHTVHHITMWVLIIFVMVHIYVAVREDIMSRQSLVSTMISGWRYFKDDRE